MLRNDSTSKHFLLPHCMYFISLKTLSMSIWFAHLLLWGLLTIRRYYFYHMITWLWLSDIWHMKNLCDSSVIYTVVDLVHAYLIAGRGGIEIFSFLTEKHSCCKWGIICVYSRPLDMSYLSSEEVSRFISIRLPIEIFDKLGDNYYNCGIWRLDSGDKPALRHCARRTT